MLACPSAVPPLRTFALVICAALCSCSGPVSHGNLTVPEGFEVELAAGPPLVERPMIIDMDEQGRLYVAESSGSTASVEDQLRERPHSILRLVDSDGDGRYDRRTVFADKMMLPEGVLWHDGSVYVAAPPQIWKLTDTDDDGVADQREVWFDAKTLTGCANDLHGPYLGPDGWIYWTKGAFAEQTYQRPGRPPLVTRASHILRRRPEGGPIEPVLTGGMDNPIEVAFNDEGERFLTSTFTEHPTHGRRDGLLHALYGGVYGKVHGVTDRHPMTGGYNPVMTQMDAVVPVGLARYESSVFGESFAGNLFMAQFNMQRVSRHELIPEGATYRTEDSDFLVSDSYDFHPTDVMEDADGSLLVVDTGAWYKICCPSSQLAKPEVLGAIYRVRRSGAAGPENPRGEELDWTRPTSALLEDPRPAVRRRALRLLPRGGVDALLDARGPHAVWALTRIEGEQAREGVRARLDDPSAAVRHAALHSVSVWRDEAALDAVLGQLRSGPAPIQRAAAEALGRIGDSRAVPALLAATATGDEALRHSLTYALIEIADDDATRKGLAAPDLRTRRAALIALDQMEPAAVTPREIVPLLSSDEPLIAETAEWIAGNHAEWGGALVGYFRTRMHDGAVTPQLAKFAGHAEIQALLAAQASAGNRVALEVIADASLDETPAAWREAIVSALATDSIAPAVAAARSLGRPEQGDAALDAALFEAARNTDLPSLTRAQAAQSSIASRPGVPDELFEFLSEHAAPPHPSEVRSAAARALAVAKLSEDQLLRLTTRLPDVGPMELPSLVQAFSAGSSLELGQQFLASLDAAGSVRADILEAAVANYPEPVGQRVRELLAERELDRDAQRRRIDQLLASVDNGDPVRGQAVFNSAEAACATCHRIGYQGGAIGPFLGSVGRSRTDRDLLESILYPSLSFVRSYEPVVAVTSTDIYSGVPIEESDTHLLLASGPDEQVRVARADIEEIRPGTVSIMPSGLDEQLSEQELMDLVAFLKDTAYKPWQRPSED